MNEVREREALTIPNHWFEPLKSYECFFLFLYPAIFVGIVVASFYLKDIKIRSNLWWGFGFTVSMLGGAFIKARRVALGGILERFVPNGPGFTGEYQSYIARIEMGWNPAIVGILTSFSAFAFSIMASWEVLHTLVTQTPYLFILTIRAIGIGFMAKSILLILSFGSLNNRLSLEMENTQKETFSWEFLESMGREYARASVGAAVISVCVLGLILSNFRLFMSDLQNHWNQVLLMEGILLMGVVIPVVYLLYPQWRLHRILLTRKNEIRQIFYSRFLQSEREFLKAPEFEKANRYLEARGLIEEIEKLPEWPFRFQTLTPILTVFAIPIGFFLVKEVLVDVLVELVKK